MFKKLILVGFVFLFSFNFARASDVIINEFSSTSNPEWVELLNTTGSDVPLTGWKLTELTTPQGTPHEVTLLPLSGTILAGGVLFFNVGTDNLNNSGDSIALYDNSSTPILMDRVTYGTVVGGNYPTTNGLGTAPTAGKSGALVSGVWKTNQEPTKGQPNPEATFGDSDSTDTIDEETTSTTSATTTTSEPKVKVIENPTMKVKISTNALAFTGQPLEMQTSVVGLLNEKVVLGRAYWNFGDGSSFEQINNFEKFSHIYYYPGEYVLFLEYYQNSFSKTPEATAKMIIKVLPTTVSISKVGDVKDFFIELSNNASSDIDISNWIINASGKIFILPKNSVIMSKKQMTISGKITGFLYGDQSNLKLYSGTGELIFDYSSSLVPVKVAKAVASSTPSSILPLDKGEMPKAEGVYPDATQAFVISSGAVENNPNNSLLPILGSIIFIGASAGTVYFIRRRKVTGKESDDFEILDE